MQDDQSVGCGRDMSASCSEMTCFPVEWSTFLEARNSNVWFSSLFDEASCCMTGGSGSFLFECATLVAWCVVLGLCRSQQFNVEFFFFTCVNHHLCCEL